jgi:hypothetical protein
VNVAHSIRGREHHSDYGNSIFSYKNVDQGGYFLASTIKIVQSSNGKYACQRTIRCMFKMAVLDISDSTNESIRGHVYQQLHRSGSGPSVMYPAALPGIHG